MKILYVEDEIAHVELTERTLEDNLQESFALIHVESFQSALKKLEDEPEIDLILTDLRLPDGSGLDLLKHVKELPSSPAVILVTGQGDEQVAVAALKSGAADYLVKEGDYLHRLPAALKNAVAQNLLAREQIALRESEERFKRIFHSTPIATCVATLEEGRFIDANPAFENLIGMEVKDLIGRTSQELGVWQTPQSRENFIADLKAHGSLTGIEVQYEHVPHRPRNTIAFYELIELGGVACILAMFYDVTDQKKTQQALQTERDFALQVLNNMGQGLTVANQKGTFEYVNPAYANMIGYTIEEIIGKTPEDFTATSSQPEIQKERTQRQQGITSTYETLLTHKSGHEVPATITGVPRRQNNEINGAIAVITDLTTQKHTEQALERQILELTILHGIATAEAKYLSESEIIEQVTKIASRIYTEVCGILLLNEAGNILVPHLSYFGANVSDWISGYPITEGVTGRAVREARAIRLDDVAKEENYIEIASNIRSELCVPIRVYENIIGVLNVESKKVKAFDENDERLLNTIAGGLGSAIERTRLFKAQETQLQREAALLNLMRAAASSLDLKLVLQTILEQLATIIPSDTGAIQLLDGDNLNIVATIGDESKPISAPDRIQLNNHPANRFVILEKRPLRIDDARLDDRFALIPKSHQTRSFLIVPLIVKKESIGLITLDSHQSARFTQQDEDLAMAIASHACIAIENAQLYQEALQAADRRAALHHVSQEIVQFTQDNEQIYKSIHQATEKLMPCDVFMVTLRNETEDENVFVYTLENGTRYSLKNEPTEIGLPGMVAEKGKSIMLNNEAALEAEKFPRFGSQTRVHSIVAVPMRVGDRNIGMISAQSYKPNSYGDEERALLEMLAAHAAIALENARQFQEETRRARIIETLANIANEIATTREIIPILDQITQRSLELLRASHVAIYLLHDDNQTLKAISAQGTHRKEIMARSLQIGEGITGNVISTGKPEIIINTTGDPRANQNLGAQEIDAPHETMISSPLILRGKTIGAINAWRLRSNGAFNKAELNFLINIGHQVSIAIESANLFQEAVQHAQESSAIAEVGRDISATLQLDLVLERIAMYAKDLLGAETSAVYLPDSRDSILKAVAAIGLDSDEIKRDHIEIGAGIVGDVARQKSGEIVNNTQSDPRTITIKGTVSAPHEHIMSAPVISKDQLTGLLVVWRSGKSNEFKLTELNFLSALAHQAAVAIENARLYDETQRRLNELETINRLSTALRNTQSPQEMVNTLLDEMLHILHIENGSIWLYEPRSNELIQKAARGFPSQFTHTRLEPSEGIIGHVFSTGNIHISGEFLTDPFVFKGNLENTPAGLGGICIPIQSSGGTIGALLIEIEKGQDINDRVGLLTTLAEITGNAIHRSELFEQSQEQVLKLTTLRDIDSAIASSTDLRVTLNILMNHTLMHLKTDAVAILLYHPELQSLTYLCSAGFRTPSPSRPLMRLGEGLAGQVVMKGKIEYIPDLRNSNEVRRDPMLSREGFIAYFGVPLVVKGQIKGVFEIFHRAPFTPTEDWTQFLHTLAGQAAIAIDNAQLFDNLQRSNQEITQAYDTTLEGWARALELRDRETEGHTRRVTDLTMQLARYMSIQDDELVNIYRGVLLHDIGKMGVPDHILRKTGPLDNSEWVEMRKHPEYAFNLLAPIPYLRPALDIPYCHHEHWDGSGYPRGLKGEDIPLSARIFSIVDIWDALLSDRSYRKAWPREKVIDYLKEISGKTLDPKVVTTFLEMISERQ